MITVCIGRRELGKSTLGYYMVQKISPRVIFDPRAQFQGNIQTTVDPDALLTMLDNNQEVIIQPLHLEDDTQALAEVLQQWLSEDKTRRLGVLIDEVGLLDLSAWDWLFRCSERGLVQFVLTFHRPVDLHTDMRAIMDTLCLFRMTMPNDLDVIENMCGAAVRDQVETLQEFEFIVFDAARGEVKRTFRKQDRASWYVPLRARRSPAELLP